MNDLYLEELVEKRKTGKDTAGKIGLIALTVVVVALAILSLNMIALALTAVVIVADILLFPHFQVEWEYLYVNGELDVDRILSRSKRKRMGSYDIADAEIVAPVSSHHLDSYKNNSNIQKVDYTSCYPERANKVYAMVIPKNNKMMMVTFEPSEQMVKDMWMKAPRKVFKD